jgi:nucleoside-triphosphatase THEP1
MAWENFLLEMAHKQQSLLIIGRPGFGKTTVLREVARILSQDRKLNVVVVDKTCEIAGDGETPHPAIGNARWMPVGRPNLQHVIMREAVENQSPDVIIVDEISTAQEVEACKTIAQRGVQLIATVHGQTLPEILNCKERGSLVGGVATITLSSHEADRRKDKRKQVQTRAKETVFKAALELHCRDQWIFHPNIQNAVDAYFAGEAVDATELHPGMAVVVQAVPQEGHFEYSTTSSPSKAASQQRKFSLQAPPPPQAGQPVVGG